MSRNSSRSRTPRLGRRNLMFSLESRAHGWKAAPTRRRALARDEVVRGSRRSIGPAALRLKSPFRERIVTFLLHPTVVQAQRNLISRSGKVALERATCWARAVRNASQPTFQEFLFFFDYLIQNGDSFTERNILQSAALTMQFGKGNLGPRDDPAVRQKMIQIKEWLEAGFKNMRNASEDTSISDTSSYAMSLGTASQLRSFPNLRIATRIPNQNDSGETICTPTASEPASELEASNDNGPPAEQFLATGTE